MIHFLVLSSLMLIGTANAADVPAFPACSNPTGNLKVEYVSGQHAIVGQSSTREGSDKVYSLIDGNTLQCFCPENGSGVQTNWWKITEMSQEDINSLKNQGWNFIPSGSDWGLSSDPYLAKNVDYSCKSTGGDGGGGSDSGIGGGFSSSVLGLAATGDNSKFFGLISLGIALLTGGLILRPNHRKNA